jgi:nitrogen regulatory protein PII
MEVAVSEKLAGKVVETIQLVCGSGKIGDGKIFILDLLEALRIRTGETGECAL